MKLVICGDSESVLKKIPNDFVDLICTDPPYGIKFMGKDWDKAIPKREIWIECLRILKPGAFAFVMCTPRQDCLSRMIVSLEDVGFWVNFTSIYWAYATGFPKAGNLSKAADKRAGAEREVIGQKHVERYPNGPGGVGFHGGPGEYSQIDRGIPMETKSATPEAKALDGAYGGFQPKPAVEVILVVMKPPTHKTWLDQALDNGKGCTWLDAGRIPTENDFKLIPAGPRGKGVFGDGGKWDRQKIIPKNQGRFPANLIASDDSLNDGKVTTSAGGEPFSGEVNRHGIYGSRYRERTGQGVGKGDSGSFSRYFSLDAWWDKKLESLPDSIKKTFPFLLTPKASKSEKNRGVKTIWKNADLSSEMDELNQLVKDISGDTMQSLENQEWNMTLFGKRKMGRSQRDIVSIISMVIELIIDLKTSNSFHSPNTKDSILAAIRNMMEHGLNLVAFVENIKKLRLTITNEKLVYLLGVNLAVSKTLLKISARGKQGNTHNTVKPLKLMSWLVSIGSREGDLVVDPFCGSGTTCLAAKMLKRDYLGIDLDQESVRITKERLALI